MAKSSTQKRRREAEADQERRQNGNGVTEGETLAAAAAAAATAAAAAEATGSTTAPPPAKKARVEERRSLFVRSLPPTATDEQLTAFFSEHFPVKHATVVTDPKTKLSRGYGFVTFTDAEDAAEAKAKLDNQLLDGRRLRLDIAEPRQRPSGGGGAAAGAAGAAGTTTTTTAAAADKKKLREAELAAERKAPKLIVRNLPWSVKTSQDLAALFRMYGKVKFADLPNQRGKLAGFGFVTLRGKKNAEKAIEGVNGKVVDGRTLAVDWAVDKQTWEQQQQQQQQQQPGDNDGKTSDAKGSAKAPKSPAKTKESAPKKTAEQEQADEDLRNFMENNMENLEEEDDDDDDKDSDDEEEEEEEEDEDDDDDDDDDAEDEDDWEDDEEDAEAKNSADDKPKKAPMTDNSATIFVRNLPFTTTDAELKTHFAQFGAVRYARIVMDRATDRPAGTGFVCFVREEDAKACLRAAPRLQQPGAAAASAAAAAAAALGKKHSVLQDERVDRDGRYTLSGRVLQLAQAVDKAEAARRFAENSAAGGAAGARKKEDRRRLFLLSEGTIAAGSPLYAQLPPAEVQMREASAKQRLALVKANPSLHLSLTRLAVRNIPRHMDAKQLKQLAREAIVGFATDVKQGLRAPLSKEELARGGQLDREAEQRRRAKGKGVVKQAKIVFETETGTKVANATSAAAGAKGGSGGAKGGKGGAQDAANKGGADGTKSRGYGFIEYWSHRWALSGLRWLNGHPLKSADGKKTQRLIVEFAIENANVVARRRANEEKARAPRPPPPREGDRREEGEDGGSGSGHRRVGKFDKFRKGGKGDKKGGDRTGPASKAGKDGKPGKPGKPGKEDAAATAKPSKKQKADTKLALRQQIIQRKRMMRKKKSQARRG